MKRFPLKGPITCAGLARLAVLARCTEMTAQPGITRGEPARLRLNLGGGHWGLAETEKPAKISPKPKNRKKNRSKPKKTPRIMIKTNPSALDRTAKILALGTIQCPCYTACSANLMRIIPKKIFAMFNQRNRFFHCLRLI